MNFQNHIIIQAAFLITNSTEGIIRSGAVVIQNDRIIWVGKSTECPYQHFSPYELVERPTHILSVGFIQTHIHLCQTLFRGMADDLHLLEWLTQRIFPFEAAHNENSMTSSAEIGLLELIGNGTTTVLDMGSVNHYESVLETAKQFGFRGYFGKALMDQNHLFPKLSESTQQALKSSEQLQKKYHRSEHDLIRYAQTPRFILSCTDDIMINSFHLASAVEKGLYHTHSSEQEPELKVVRERCGMDNVEYFEHHGILSDKTALAHCIWLNDREVQLLKERQTRILHCPSSNLKLGSGIAKIPQLLKEKIKVSIGADGAPCNNNLDPFIEMRLAALIQKPFHHPAVMNAKTVYELMTIEGAKSLHWDEDLGQLSIGKKADLISISLDEEWMPLYPESDDEIYSAIVYSAQRLNISDVWINGKIKKWKGELVGIDREQKIQVAKNELKKLVGRL